MLLMLFAQFLHKLAVLNRLIMKKQIFLLSGLLITILTIQGCKVEGCTDADAVNYSLDADTDDGSCEYSGSVVFWYGEEVAVEKQQWATAYTFWVDGQIVGSQAVSVYWNGAPDCGQDASITVERDLGNVTSIAAEYEVIDDSGFVVWEGIVNFRANTCEAIELTL